MDTLTFTFEPGGRPLYEQLYRRIAAEIASEIIAEVGRST